MSGLDAAAQIDSPPPRQKPTEPTCPLHCGCCSTYWTAPRISFSASSMFKAIACCSASSGCLVVFPWYRSGASARKPSCAKLSTIFRTSSSSPHHSPSTTTAGASPSGSARYPWAVAPLASNSTSGISVLLRLSQLLGERPPHGDANHHSHARLLGEQRADGCYPLIGIRNRRRLEHLGLVRLAEPASRVEGIGEDSLELRRGTGDHRLDLPEPPRLGQRVERRVQLLLRVRAGHGANIPRRR